MSDTNPSVKNRRYGKIIIFDGDTPPNKIIVDQEEGNLTFGIPNPDAGQHVGDRGALGQIIRADEQEIAGSFTANFRKFLGVGGDDVTPFEAMLQKGNAAAWVSTLPANYGSVYTFGLQFICENPDNTVQSEIITFNYCRAGTQNFSETARANQLTHPFIDHEVEPSYTTGDMS